jgi:putative endonuclease
MHNPSPHQRRNSELQGRQAEDFVAAVWASRGFSILGQRVRTPAGELDLIVADAETLIFVEVKARRSFTEAAYAVVPNQQKRLLAAADSAMASNPDWCRPAARFDVALVSGGAIQFIEDAIRP